MFLARGCILAVLLYAVAAFAVPYRMNYQGHLAAPDGTPLDTTVAITFNLYVVPAGGVSVWTETHPSVTVTDGLFDVQLGSVNPLVDPFTTDRWLGMAIGNDTEMAPRAQFLSVTYALRVGTVDGASGGQIVGNLHVSGKGRFGQNSTNDGQAAFVAGQANHATSTYSSVTGGALNWATGGYAHVGGGQQNRAGDGGGANYQTVGGGLQNYASAYATVVAGGSADSARGPYSTISGGENNVIWGSHATIGGGKHNRASGDFAVAMGGGGPAAADSNSAAGEASVIGGGRGNLAENTASTVAGGQANVATGLHSTVGGGQNNHARGTLSVVAGGGGLPADSNSASGQYSVIGGGYRNSARGGASVVAGGGLNSTHTNATVSGGFNNEAGGFASTVSGGTSNMASGVHSTIPGGSYNLAAGDNSFAAGFHASANHLNSFVWASSITVDTESFGPQTFTARAPGGARFYSADGGTSSGVELPANGGAWNSLCDVNQKTLHGAVNTAEVLQRVSALPLHRWSYKRQGASIQHIGPTAQDFHAAFGLGDNNTTISTLDPDGVALAAIQELARQMNELKAENQRLQSEMQALRASHPSTVAK